MTGAHELVGAAVPGNNATEVGADGIDAVAADGVIAFDDQISGVTFETLNKAAVAAGVVAQPTTGGDRITQLILGRGAATATSSPGGDEVIHHRIESAERYAGHGPEGQQIHKLPAAHSGHITCWRLSHN